MASPAAASAGAGAADFPAGAEEVSPEAGAEALAAVAAEAALADNNVKKERLREQPFFLLLCLHIHERTNDSGV